MFTGIIECTGRVEAIREEGTNKVFTIASPISHELKVDQSVSHNGICLTVEHIQDGSHTVSAVKETIDKTNLNFTKPGDIINLERSLLVNGRLDGHFVQGHVDDIGQCTKIENQEGSWEIYFQFKKKYKGLIIPKGSIAINGISLTVIDPGDELFHVAIIPYTYHHTNFKQMAVGDFVNLEFDILGKYLLRNMELLNSVA